MLRRLGEVRSARRRAVSEEQPSLLVCGLQRRWPHVRRDVTRYVSFGRGEGVTSYEQASYE